MLGPPKQIPMQSLLYKKTICLTRQATTFFVSKMKNACLKQPLQNITQRKMGKKRKATMHKKETSLRLYLLYCYFMMQS